MLPIWIAGGTGVFLITLLILHARSAPRRAWRAAHRAHRPVRLALRRPHRLRRGAQEKLQSAALDFSLRQKATDFAQTPLASLREVGVSHIRWSALEEAGIETLGDLARWTRRRLIEIDGIGEKSADEILSGSTRMKERVDQEPPRPPTPQLRERGGFDVARHALFVLDLEERLAPLVPFLEEEQTLAEEIAALRQETRFFPWLKLLLRPRSREEFLERAEGLEQRSENLDADPDLKTGLAIVDELRKERPSRSADEVASRYGESFAACVAEIERALGTNPSSASGAFSPELLAKIEGRPLQLEGFRWTLRGYQQFGAQFILSTGGTLLGDEMGLGKTVQALAAATTLHHEEPQSRTLVVMPAGLLYQWVREARTMTPLLVSLAHGAEKESAVAEWLEKGGLLAVSYATLRTLGLDEQLEERRLALVIADEAHYVKNPEAKRTQALAALLDRAERRCFMTGTPLENHPDEFQRLLTLLDPSWHARTERGFHDRTSGFLDPRIFQERVAEVYLRRTQRDVLTELPPRLERDEWVELTEEERTAYQELVRAGDFMGLRQVATQVRGDQPSSKLERLAECLEEHREEGRKVVVFSYFLSALDACRSVTDVVGTIHGGVSPADREEIIEEFRAAPAGAVLLGQIVAAGVGLNLQCASAVILLEPQLKPALEAQAIARAHRMGQTRRILVHRLLAAGTIDARLRQRLAEKAELFDRYAEGSVLEAAWSQEDSTEEDAGLAAALLQEERDRLHSPDA